jgi:hypothetical protein
MRESEESMRMRRRMLKPRRALGFKHPLTAVVAVPPYCLKSQEQEKAEKRIEVRDDKVCLERVGSLMFSIYFTLYLEPRSFEKKLRRKKSLGSGGMLAIRLEIHGDIARCFLVSV